MSAPKILIADKDSNTLDLVEMRLQVRDYEVFVATHSDEAVRLAQKVRFDLVFLSSTMEQVDGLDLCRKIKQCSANFGVPVILLAEAREIRQLALSPERGVDDFLIKPFDAFSLQLRVELTMMRARERLQANPLTSLPGSLAIESEIKRRIERNDLFSVCYLDINHFKSFNDHYGFDRGDSVIRHTAQIIVKCLEVCGAAQNSLVGHIGGDDYIVVMDTEWELIFARKCLAEFDRIIPSYYDEEDRKRGSISVENRNGAACSFPLMSLAVAAAANKNHPYTSMAEIARDLAEVKSYLKSQPGSHYLRDRRRDPVTSLEETFEILPTTELEKRKFTKPIGQMLLEIGLIHEEELNRAVRQHLETGERIGQVLLRMNALTSDQLGSCLGRKLGVKYVSLKDHMLSDDVTELLSTEVMRNRQVVPLRVYDNRLEVAMANPLDQNTMDEIHALSGFRVVPKFALENEVEEFLEKHIRKSGYWLKREQAQ
ncbi:MAG: hypothetical protein A3G87_04030 [Omnitrophica bacterium RIFCSPLOWO2_12_FULL_50_11]|nr:MAG: hypothetical protein A3G87_04030 [Omnitrophica bacterium RIFCSPLOWO2_12_FULL_50_11]